MGPLYFFSIVYIHYIVLILHDSENDIKQKAITYSMTFFFEELLHEWNMEAFVRIIFNCSFSCIIFWMKIKDIPAINWLG